MRCHTQQEIADAVGMSIGSVNAFTEKFQNGQKSDLEFFRNLTPEVYTTWSFGKAVYPRRVEGERTSHLTML